MTIPAWAFNIVITLIGIMIIYVWSASSTKTEIEATSLIDLSEYDEFYSKLNIIMSFLYSIIIFLSFSIEMPLLLGFIYLALINSLEQISKSILSRRYGN
nr:hypothetical protein [Tissierella sp.]